MKIILSRKGFDSQNGGQPSPILPDGTLLSLPIPYRKGIVFSDVLQNNDSYLDIIKQLKPRTLINDNTFCHLDPDIRIDAISRDTKWNGLFGQSGGAQTHLENEKVKDGDIFLFFGWFKQTEMTEKGLRYVRGAPDLHVIYGYLQIAKKYTTLTSLEDSVKYHPHAEFDEVNNCIYEASKHLSFDKSKLGYGTFDFKKSLVLTKEGESRSKWELPQIFKNVTISHHNDNSFKNGYFQSAMIGQEFVVEDNEDITNWMKEEVFGL